MLDDAAPVLGRQRPIQRRDDACREGPIETERVPDRERALPDAQIGAAAKRQRLRHPRQIHLQDREVVSGADAHDRRVDIAAIA